jgi:hypothetical protein
LERSEDLLAPDKKLTFNPKEVSPCQVCWSSAVIPALGRLRQGNKKEQREEEKKRRG